MFSCQMQDVSSFHSQFVCVCITLLNSFCVTKHALQIRSLMSAEKMYTFSEDSAKSLTVLDSAHTVLNVQDQHKSSDWRGDPES